MMEIFALVVCSSFTGIPTRCQLLAPWAVYQTLQECEAAKYTHREGVVSGITHSCWKKTIATWEPVR